MKVKNHNLYLKYGFNKNILTNLKTIAEIYGVKMIINVIIFLTIYITFSLYKSNIKDILVKLYVIQMSRGTEKNK